MLNMPNLNRMGMPKKDKSETWNQISPWVHSAWISSITTFALRFVFILFPGIKEFIGACAPFRGAPLTFFVWTCFVYLTIGVAISRWLLFTGFGWRSTLSSIFLNVAVAISLFVIPLPSVISALAIKDWNIAIETWRGWEGNHGPWYRLYHLRRLVNYAFQVPQGSLYFASLSFIIRCNKLALVVLLGSIVLFFSLIFTHHWLID